MHTSNSDVPAHAPAGEYTVVLRLADLTCDRMPMAATAPWEGDFTEVVAPVLTVRDSHLRP